MPSQRVCGGCTACCKTHPILSLDKPIGKWCKDCIIGKGCGIYEKRPTECTDFKCQWLMGYDYDQHRPDRSKIVTDFYKLDVLDEKIVSLWEVSEGTLDRECAEYIATEMLYNNLSVLYIYLSGNRMVLYIPPNKILTEEQKKVLAKNSIELGNYMTLQV